MDLSRFTKMATVVALTVAALTGCSTETQGKKEINQNTFNGDWPFTVDKGTLKCEGSSSVTFTANGTTYAVNGTAKDQTDYPDVDPIWKKTDSNLKVQIGDVIDEGLKLCK